MKFFLPNLDTQHHSENLHSLEEDHHRAEVSSENANIHKSPSPHHQIPFIWSEFSCPIVSPNHSPHDSNSLNSHASTNHLAKFYNFDEEESEERNCALDDDLQSESSVIVFEEQGQQHVLHDESEKIESVVQEHEFFSNVDCTHQNSHHGEEHQTMHQFGDDAIEHGTLRHRHTTNITVTPANPSMVDHQSPSMSPSSGNSQFSSSSIHFNFDAKERVDLPHLVLTSPRAKNGVSRHSRIASSSSNLSTLSPYTTSYMKYNKFMDDSLTTGDNHLHFADDIQLSGTDLPDSSFTHANHHDHHQQCDPSISSFFGSLLSFIVPSMQHQEIGMSIKKRKQIDAFFTQYWRILKCPHSSPKSNALHRVSTPEGAISPPEASIPFLPFAFLDPSSSHSDSPHSSGTTLILLTLFIAFVLFIFVHFLPPTSLYTLDISSQPNTLNTLQSYALVFISCVLLGVLYQNKHLWESCIHIGHEKLLSEVESFHPKLRLFNSKIQFLMSLILEVQLIAKGYQIVFPLNTEIVSNLEWNEYSIGQENSMHGSGGESKAVGAYCDLRRIVLTNLLKLNEYVEMCIEHIRRSVGLEHELFDLVKSHLGKPDNEKQKSTATPSTPSTASADYSLSLKYLKLKHLELRQNAQTLSQILLHVFQQSQMSSMIPNHIILYSFDELLRSPLIGLSSVVEECIQELKLCETYMVGGVQHSKKESNIPESPSDLNQTPVQVLTQQYFLSRMNTSLTELRANLNLFQHMRCDLRDKKTSVDDCARMYHRIRTDMIDNLRQSFDESAMFYLKSVTREEDREKRHAKTGLLWKEASQQAKGDMPQSTELASCDEPTLYNSAPVDVKSSSTCGEDSVQDARENMSKKTPVYVFKPAQDALPEENSVDPSFRLPNINLLSASKKRRVMVVTSVDNDDDSEAPSPPDVGLRVPTNPQPNTPILGKKQQNFLREMSGTVARSQKEPKSMLMSEMKNVLSRRTRDFEYHFDDYATLGSS
mmetsp:Transcript_6934/g.25930  ORF Transcript_6934/g.25930 Transcript_6934/m.25930 type:complete len:991 (-) Transcript_6934:919-3891(-)|eukprot:CAMPEP_0117436410 /NCGR_PEP_ID=MMETSP0759-20121206/992_1 /TAXON_ID=63605 /ORGANISM="Percolomonas cosmopolitus, Strain WS" /LENGTH=990 /DNA_ID=CAMNT_0005228007 /DNA_START=42 /DNA_END=3014 /DNA_ORIENTATION=-